MSEPESAAAQTVVGAAAPGLPPTIGALKQAIDDLITGVYYITRGGRALYEKFSEARAMVSAARPPAQAVPRTAVRPPVPLRKPRMY